jgi:hypothetical protein
MDRQLRDLLGAAVGEPPHRVSAAAVHRRVIRRRVVEYVAAAAAVAAIAAIVPVGIGALGRGTGPSAGHARIVISRHYGYTETLPAGWRPATQATQRWNGKGAPADLSNVVDLFIGPSQVEAWAIATPTQENLAAYTSATIRASDAGHSCSAPRTGQAITIGGAPARLLGLHCPAHSRFLVEIAVTVHQGTAYVFSSQNPTATTATNRAADRAAFRNFLAGIRLRR